MVLSLFFSERALSATFHLTIPDANEGSVPQAFADTGFECRDGKDEICTCSLCQSGSFNRKFSCLPCSAGNWRKITGWINHPPMLYLCTFLYMRDSLSQSMSWLLPFSPSPRNQYWSQLSGEWASEVELFLAVAMRSIYDIGWRRYTHVEIVRSQFWWKRTGNRWGQAMSDWNSTQTLSAE